MEEQVDSQREYFDREEELEMARLVVRICADIDRKLISAFVPKKPIDFPSGIA